MAAADPTAELPEHIDTIWQSLLAKRPISNTDIAALCAWAAPLMSESARVDIAFDFFVRLYRGAPVSPPAACEGGLRLVVDNSK